VGGGHDGMGEIVELKAVSGCVADFGRIVAWALCGTPIRDESERKLFAFFTLRSRKHTTISCACIDILGLLAYPTPRISKCDQQTIQLWR